MPCSMTTTNFVHGFATHYGTNTNYKGYKQQRSLFKIQQLSFGVGVSFHQGRSIIDTGLQKINDQIYIF